MPSSWSREGKAEYRLALQTLPLVVVMGGETALPQTAVRIGWVTGSLWTCLLSSTKMGLNLDGFCLSWAPAKTVLESRF